VRASAPDVELPERFRVTGHIANGGMASVWAAEDRTLGRIVAIKLLAPQFLDDPTAKARFEREARAAASLSDHPHVVTIFDVGECEDRPFIVMEHMSGGSLADVLRNRGEPPRADALRWLRGAAEALDYAHGRGIVHRDVKPANLLLDARARLGVGDFGIARAGLEQTITSTGQVLGTAAYLSPEQAEGEAAGPPSDRYSLAVVGYELLTGARPFAGASFAAQARAHLEDAPTPPSERPDAAVPASADPVLLRGMAKDPEARWPTATALVDALERALAGGPEAPTEATRPMTTRVAGAAARPPRTPARPRPRAPIPPPPGAPPTRPPGAAGSQRRWVGLAVAGVAALLVAVALAALTGGDDERPAADRAPGGSTSPAPGAERDRGAQTGTSASGADDGSSVSALNDEGFGLINQGRPGDAVPILQQAVDRCGSSTELTCAYALYNLGHALRLAGRPAEAIPILERRLEIPNQQDVVQRELDLAREQAGVSSGGDGGDEGGRENGNGKGRGKGKKD